MFGTLMEAERIRGNLILELLNKTLIILMNKLRMNFFIVQTKYSTLSKLIS